MIRSTLVALLVFATTSIAQAGTPAENAVWALKAVMPVGSYIGTIPGTNKYCSVSNQNLKGSNMKEFLPTLRMDGRVASPWNTYYSVDRNTGVSVPGMQIVAGGLEVNTTFYSISGFKMSNNKLTLTTNTIPNMSVNGVIWPAQTTVTVTENTNHTMTVQTQESMFDPHSNWSSTRSFACTFPF